MLAALPSDEQAELPTFKRLFAADFMALPQSAIKSSGYVVDSLEAAVWVAGNATDFKQGVMTAASLGEDTDTVATIAASLLAASGKDVIPADWWHAIVSRELAESYMRPFAQKFAETNESN